MEYAIKNTKGEILSYLKGAEKTCDNKFSCLGKKQKTTTLLGKGGWESGMAGGELRTSERKKKWRVNWEGLPERVGYKEYRKCDMSTFLESSRCGEIEKGTGRDEP